MKNKFIKLTALLMALLSFGMLLLTGCKDAPASEEPEEETTETTQTEPSEEATEPTTGVSREPGKFFVTVLPGVHGTVQADKAQAKKGETITLTVTPEEGYMLASLTVNGEESELTFQMPEADVIVLARFALNEEEVPEDKEEPIIVNGTFFGQAGSFLTSPVLNVNTDKGSKPYLMLDAKKATPLYAYVKGVREEKVFFQTNIRVDGIRSDEKYPKFGIMVSGSKEMVKLYLDMDTKLQVASVGVVHQKNGGNDDWAGQTTYVLPKKLDMKMKTIKLALVKDGTRYYLYLNDELVVTGNDLPKGKTAIGCFSFGTVAKLSGYQVVKSGESFQTLLNTAKKDAQAFAAPALTQNYFTDKGNGKYTLKTNSDALHMVDEVTTSGKTMRYGYYSLKGKLTLTDAQTWGQSRILISNNPDNEYFIALEKLENGYQVFTMSNVNKKGWDNWELIANTDKNSIDFEVIMVGDVLYFLLDDQICYQTNRVPMTQSTVKFTGYNQGTTTVEKLSLKTFANAKAAKDYVAGKAVKPAPEPGPEPKPLGLTTHYFAQNQEDVYTLTTNSDAQHLVDDVLVKGKVMKANAYSLKGKLSLTDAESWGQARILVSADASNEYVIALEKVNDSGYQIFTMSKANEESWNDWRLIAHCETNGDRNSIDFELIVCDGVLYFLVDDKICYQSSRVTLGESTVKFTGYNVATTTVENLALEIFSNTQQAAAYVDGKEEAPYVSRFQTRFDSLYNEYIVEHGCTGKGGTLIFGDSYMDFWGNWENQTGLIKYENGYNVGIGGSAIKDWLLAYEQLVKPFAPERIILNIGYNDVNVWGDDGEEFAQNLKTLLEKIHADFPETEIYYIYINPSPSVYANGAYTNQKVEKAINCSKELVAGLDYVTGIDIFDLMTTEDDLNPVAAYYVSDNIHLTEEGYKALSAHLYDQIFRGNTFGQAESHITTNGMDLTKDQGENATISAVGGAPQYAYVHGVYTDKFVFETQFNVKSVLNGDNWPKFGLLVSGPSEMVKFFVDMTPQMTATHVGVVYQPVNGGDDWANSISTNVAGMSFTGSNTIKLKLVRDGKAYYFYVNDKLVLYNAEGFKSEKGAVGIFSFNTQFVASKYQVVTGTAANNGIEAAKEDVAELNKLSLTCNWFVDNGNGSFSLTTNSNAEHKVDDLTQGGNVLRAANYSVSGKLKLTNAGDWGQARILVSADASNEYFIALERTSAGKYQIFTMSKSNQSRWDRWELILHENDNGTRNVIDFEIVVIGNRLNFLIDGKVVYTNTRVPMTQSAVKFTGYNVGTTTIEALSAQVFKNAQEAESYLEGKV